MVIGIVHISAVFPIEKFSLYDLWFITAGVAIIFSGLINLLYLRNTSNFQYYVCLFTNVVMLLLFIIALIVMNEYQVYLGIIINLLSVIFVITINSGYASNSK